VCVVRVIGIPTPIPSVTIILVYPQGYKKERPQIERHPNQVKIISPPLFASDQ